MAPALVNNNAKSNADTGQRVTLSNGSVKDLEDMSVRERDYYLEMARLETALQAIQAENKLNKFKEEVLFLNLQAPFKLKGKGNYDDWSIEMESIALMLEAQPILKDRQLTCPEDIKDDGDKKIWEFKSKTLFSIMYAGLKPSVRRMIMDRINTKSRSAAEFWIALETEYKDYAFHSREDLTDKLININIADFNGDVIKYINAFTHTDARLRNLDLEEPLPKWFVTDRFIAGLNDHYWDFIQSQKDKTRDWRNKAKIEELDLRFIMDCLIARAMNRANREE